MIYSFCFSKIRSSLFSDLTCLSFRCNKSWLILWFASESAWRLSDSSAWTKIEGYTCYAYSVCIVTADCIGYFRFTILRGVPIWLLVSGLIFKSVVSRTGSISVVTGFLTFYVRFELFRIFLVYRRKLGEFEAGSILPFCFWLLSRFIVAFKDRRGPGPLFSFVVTCESVNGN